MTTKNPLEIRVSGYQDARKILREFLLEMIEDSDEILEGPKSTTWMKNKAEGTRDFALDSLAQLQLHGEQ